MHNIISKQIGIYHNFYIKTGMIMLNEKLHRTIILLIIFLFIISGTAFPQNKEKKVGLVLSGGGALGVAHIGVLKIIEKYNIPVDYITGTSMGAIIGALYASGYTAAEIETIVKSVDWLTLLSDKKERKTIDINDRELFEKNILSIHFEKGKLKVPEGAVYGQNVYNLLSQLTWHVREIDDFSKLPIPFKCIATDIQSGDAVVLERGNLADAVRASMSIPSVFSPVEIDGRLLVDGGVIRNIPVSDIKRMGADIAIVSDVGTPMYSKEELKSLFTVFDQLMKLTFSTSNEYELSLADRIITYNLKGYSIASFLESNEIMQLGDEAALEHEEYFKKLYAELKRERRTSKPDEIIFTAEEIKIRGNNRTDEKYILKNLGIKKNEIVTKEKLKNAVSSLYGTGDFNLIRYRAKNNTLHLLLNEAPPGLNSFGLNYNNYDGASVLLNIKNNGFILDDSTVRVKLKLSENYLAGIKYTLPVLFNLIDFNIEGKYYRKDFYLYDGNDDKELQGLSDFYSASASFEYNYFKSFKPGIAADYNFITYKDEISPDDIYEDIAYFNSGLYIKLDTLNKAVYPDRGMSLYLRGEYVKFNDYFSDAPVPSEDNVDDYFQIKVKSEIYFPLTDFITFNPSFTGGFSDLGGQESFGYFTGGFKDDIDKNFISFKGIFPGDIFSRNVISADAELHFFLTDIFVFSPFYSRLYRSFPDALKTLNSFGTSIALLTPIGPVEIAAAKADIKDLPIVYINIGFNF